MPSTFQIASMIGDPSAVSHLPDGRLVRVVPRPFYHGLWGRLKGAWKVICGKAFPVIWPLAGELEEALGSPKPVDRPRRAEVGDEVRFHMPVNDEGMMIDRGVLARSDGLYRYITVYLLTQEEPIEIERYENEVTVI